MWMYLQWCILLLLVLMFMVHRISMCCIVMNIHNSFYIWSLLTLLAVKFTLVSLSCSPATLHSPLLICKYSFAGFVSLRLYIMYYLILYFLFTRAPIPLLTRSLLCCVTLFVHLLCAQCDDQCAFFVAITMMLCMRMHRLVCLLCTRAWKNVPVIVRLHSQKHPQCELSIQIRGLL